MSAWQTERGRLVYRSAGQLNNCSSAVLNRKKNLRRKRSQVDKDSAFCMDVKINNPRLIHKLIKSELMELA